MRVRFSPKEKDLADQKKSTKKAIRAFFFHLIIKSEVSERAVV